MTQTIIKGRRSQLISSLFYLNGKPFSLEDYPPHVDIYDGPQHHVLIMSGRQVGKSTWLNNMLCFEPITIPGFKSLYIAPGKKRVEIFSNTRVDTLLKNSPTIASIWNSLCTTDNVFLKVFRTGSLIQLSYADVNADRVRGLSADRVLLDEVQLMLYDEVFPVVLETLSNSQYRYKIYAGTPLTMENTIQFLWDTSTQGEWLIKCEHCGKYNVISSEKSIGKKGVVCLNCGKLLNVRNGFWYHFKPDARIIGYHIPQVIIPANVEKHWDDILYKYETYPKHKFYNEVLGVSSAYGAKLISVEDIKAAGEEYEFPVPAGDYLRHQFLGIVAGIDWSGGGLPKVQGTEISEPRSRTALWIFGIRSIYPLRLVTLFYKAYIPGDRVLDQIDEIVTYLYDYRVQMVLADAGEGYVANAMVQRKFKELYQIQYTERVSGNVRWNNVDRYVADRTYVIDNVMKAIIDKEIIYPASHIDDFKDDILNLYEERDLYGIKRRWRHPPTKPDDLFMAQCFAWVAAKLFVGLKFE